MKLRVFIALLLCRASRFIIRLMGRGGTDYPGRIAVCVCPDLLGVMARDVITIIVTGTNGKTTTSRMIEQCLSDTGLSYFANKSGANLLTGITTEFAVNSTLFGRCEKDYALIECDEAAFKQVSLLVNAKVVVVTNVFRDQLDRYGEITHTLNNIKIGLVNSPEAVVCINADCSLSSSLPDEIPNRILYYGVEGEIYSKRVREVSDAPYCIFCKSEYEYDYITYGHLGGYRCPVCGYHRPDTQISVTGVILSDADRSIIEIRLMGAGYTATVNLPGGYNIYNAAAAAAAGKALGIEDRFILNAIAEFECGFGRMEKFTVEGIDMRMILIKNPAGCNQVLNFLASGDQKLLFVALLNDRAADGTDVSWIWDVDFERLNEMDDRLTGVIVSGQRADDMAMRFLYAGLEKSKIRVIRDYDELIREILDQDSPVYIMPTYTAMLDLRDKLSKNFGFKDFWE